MKKKVLGMLIVTMTGMLIACSSESEPKETVGGAPAETVGTSLGSNESDTTEQQTKDNTNDLDSLSDEYLLSLPETSPDDFMYEENDEGGIRIEGYLGERTEDTIIVIPAQIDGKDVTEIRKEAFIRFYGKAIVTGKNVKTIGEGAFTSCNVKKILINGPVTQIVENTFIIADVEEVKLPDTLEEIGNGAFTSCQLKTIEIPSSVTLIAGGSFCLSKLEEVYIKGEEVNVESTAFGSMSALKKVYVTSGNVNFDEGAFYLTEDVTIVAPAGSKAEEFAKANGINIENN